MPLIREIQRCMSFTEKIVEFYGESSLHCTEKQRRLHSLCADGQGHSQEQLTQTLIVFLLKTHLFLLFLKIVVPPPLFCAEINLGHRGISRILVLSSWSSVSPWFPLLSLEALDEGRLFSADVGTGAAVDEDVKVVAAAASVLPQKALVVSLSTKSGMDNLNYLLFLNTQT